MSSEGSKLPLQKRKLQFSAPPVLPVSSEFKYLVIWNNRYTFLPPKILMLTVEGFNQKYKGRYCLKEGGEYSEDFWVVYDSAGVECGAFCVEDNYLTETQYSLRTFGFVDKLDSEKEEPVPSRRCTIL